MKRYLTAINNEFIIPAQTGIRGISWNDPLATVRKVYHHFFSDSLYRNSIYLMLSTAIMSFFGFFFWIINARLFTPEQVGIATALISVMTLISSFSIFGLNVGLVRFLPKSNAKNDMINSSFIISILASILISSAFLFGLQYLSPKLLFLRENIFYMLTFVFFVAALSVNTIVESIFVAYRSAKYTLLKNTVLSIVKIILPIFLVIFSAYGIFASVGIANILAMLFSISILIYFFKFFPQIIFDLTAVSKIGFYSFENYLASFLNLLPSMLLPIIIVNKLGTQESAYFYIAFMIANLIFTIPMATTQSLFAEGSYNEQKILNYTKKATKIIFVTLIPVIFIIVFFGNLILLAFGKNYSTEALLLLQLLSVSSIITSINYIIGTIIKIKNKIRWLILGNLIGSLSIILLTYFIFSKSLSDIGISWIIGQFIILVFYLFTLRRIL